MCIHIYIYIIYIYTRMPSNPGTERAPFLASGNFIRSLGLQKGKKGPLGGLIYKHAGHALSLSLSIYILYYIILYIYIIILYYIYIHICIYSIYTGYTSFHLRASSKDSRSRPPRAAHLGFAGTLRVEAHSYILYLCVCLCVCIYIYI